MALVAGSGSDPVCLAAQPAQPAQPHGRVVKSGQGARGFYHLPALCLGQLAYLSVLHVLTFQKEIIIASTCETLEQCLAYSAYRSLAIIVVIIIINTLFSSLLPPLCWIMSISPLKPVVTSFNHLSQPYLLLTPLVNWLKPAPCCYRHTSLPLPSWLS